MALQLHAKEEQLAEDVEAAIDGEFKKFVGVQRLLHQTGAVPIWTALPPRYQDLVSGAEMEKLGFWAREAG